MGQLFYKGLKLMILIFFFSNTLMDNQVFGQKIKLDKEVRLLALGDSSTIGESVETIMRWPHQFVDELRKLGKDAQIPDYIATTGWTTRDLLTGIASSGNREKDYNLVSILIGVNNQYQGLDISIYEPELRNIIDQAIQITGKDTSRVFMISIPDYAFTPFGKGDKSISSEIDSYNEISRRVALEYGILRVDITPISRRGIEEPALVAGDGLHPSGKQYREWVGEIISKLGSSTTKQLDSR